MESDANISNVAESPATPPPRSRGQIRRDSKMLARSVVLAAAAERAKAQKEYRDTVRRQSYAVQRHWLKGDDVIRLLGPDWCQKELDKLDTIETRIREAVPSGAWFDAIWRRGETFPPQDKFDRSAVLMVLNQWLAGKLISVRLHARCRVLLNAGVDPVQILARWAAKARMRPAKVVVRYGAGTYIEGNPTAGQHTHRLTPPQSIGFNDGAEDRYDRMTTMEAFFCKDESSVTAKQFRTIEALRGRDERESERDKKARLKAERAKIKAAKAKAGIIDDEPDAPETIDDEVIDVDCTDVTGI